MHINKTPFDCSGCSLCEFNCPTHAIKMEQDKMGFLYPQINPEKCIECGVCIKSCSFDKGYIRNNNFKQLFFGGRYPDQEILRRSQSGGIGYIIAKKSIEKNSVVYGAAYDEHLSVKHIRIDNTTEIWRLQGSKYVQSDIRPILKLLCEDIKKGLKITFFGTPCQVSAIRRLKELHRYNDILLVDLICRGVASPMIWKDYLCLIQEENNAHVLTPNLRDKQFGWDTHIESYVLSDDKKISFPNRFYSPICFRKSCSECPFCDTNRVGDISIGDLWNVGIIPDAKRYEDNNGVSCIIVNNEIGADFFNDVKDSLDYIQVSKENVLQEQLIHPVKLKQSRNKFEYEYIQKGYKSALQKYGFLSYEYKLKKMIHGLLKHILSILK